MKRGDVAQIGDHRIMCGDAGDSDDVAQLFDGAVPDLVFTSPPYLQQREYGAVITCWDTLMRRVFGAMPHHKNTQLVANLGMAYQDGEWVPYWDSWVDWMRGRGWKRAGLYVWDKLCGHVVNAHFRPRPSYKFLFHFFLNSQPINKCAQSKHPGKRCHRGHHTRSRWQASHFGRVAETKAPDDVWRIHRDNKHGTGHPAVFPVALPAALHAAFSRPHHLVYDPFGGSGTSVIAAAQGGRRCYAMEIHPPYADAAVARCRAAIARHVPYDAGSFAARARQWAASRAQA